MSQIKPAPACQSIFAHDGELLFAGEWNPQAIFGLMSLDDELWTGKRVLDIASNTSGLSIEIARQGASVVALEPDPYNNTIAKARTIVDQVIEDESLDLILKRAEVYDAHNFGVFDVIVCFGLIYHLRYPQLLLDYLSSIGMDYLFISTQTHPGNDLALFNRRDPKVLPPGHIPQDVILSGWHPTRPLFQKMLEWAGFGDIKSLTETEYNFPNKQSGLTNSSYFRARHKKKVDLEAVRREFYPR